MLRARAASRSACRSEASCGWLTGSRPTADDGESDEGPAPGQAEEEAHFVRIDRSNGVLYIGDQGWLISSYDNHELGRDQGAPAWTAPDKSIAPSPGHYKERIYCCAARTQPTCSFEYAVPLTETVLLANAAFRGARGKRITWDAKR